jgi:Protein of unknown function (DUF3617)
MSGPGQAVRDPLRWVFALAALAAPMATMQPAGAAEADIVLAAGQYDVVAQTILPNLEESLRYATTRSQRCLGQESATTLFPILLHPAFAGCGLVRQNGKRDEATFTLQCTNPEAATGSALVLVDAQRFDGTLDLKMGGKNMTLSQRISGARKGDCPK